MIVELLLGAVAGILARETMIALQGVVQRSTGRKGDAEILDELSQSVRAERLRASGSDLRPLAAVEIAANSLSREARSLAESIARRPSATAGVVGDAVVQEVVERAVAAAAKVDLYAPSLAAIEVPVTLPPPADDLVEQGRFLSGYRLEAVLGMGGFGTVYRGRNRLGRTVAVKVPHHRALTHRLLGEAERVVRLRHPAIVSLENVVVDETDHPHLIMELVEGTTLREALRPGPLEEATVVSVVEQVLGALEHASGKGVLHLDLKPENIMLARASDGTIHAKVLDFGIGRVTAEAGARIANSLSFSGSGGRVAGTPDYMAPEQRSGAKDLDVRADLYALAVTAFELRRGTPPRGNARLRAAHEGLNRFFDASYAEERDERPRTVAGARSLLRGGETGIDRPSSMSPAAALHTVVGPSAPVDCGWLSEPLPSGMRRGKESPVVIHDTGKGLKIEMVYVRPGDFVMGSDDGGLDERPKHVRSMPRGYYIGRTPTTVASFRRFIEAAGHRTEAEAGLGMYVRIGSRWENKVGSSWRRPEFAQNDDHPVVGVSWNDAKAFCDWAGLVLPSESMWEKAARGTDGRTYPWGAADPTVATCVWSGNPIYGDRSTAPVGRSLSGASAYGALDMAGNVWEWCADSYERDAYQRYASGDTSPAGIGDLRVNRGGSWRHDVEACRSAKRHGIAPSHRSSSLGFRPCFVALAP